MYAQAVTTPFQRKKRRVNSYEDVVGQLWTVSGKQDIKLRRSMKHKKCMRAGPQLLTNFDLNDDGKEAFIASLQYFFIMNSAFFACYSSPNAAQGKILWLPQ